MTSTGLLFAVGLASLSAGLVCLGMLFRNLGQYRRAVSLAPRDTLLQVSVLIPARNEVARIGPTLAAVLASEAVDLELVVLDDHSTDGTAELVRQLSATDARVRLVAGKPLEAGWNGKQFACWQLNEAARYDLRIFLDADVLLAPTAIARLVTTKQSQGIGLLSAFPRQVTLTWGERLLIPLIPYILLCHLPFRTMRRTKSLAAAAGCGQLFLTDRASYLAAGGHAALRASRHDGLQLPRAYRRAGLVTDLVDGFDLASCRMYEGWAQTWSGLAKNATEGVARMPLLLVVTVLWTLAHLVPWPLFACAIAWHDTRLIVVSTVSILVSLLTRAVVAHSDGEPLVAILLHPVSIALFLTIQWTAWLRSLLGLRTTWRGRT